MGLVRVETVNLLKVAKKKKDLKIEVKTWRYYRYLVKQIGLKKGCSRWQGDESGVEEGRDEAWVEKLCAEGCAAGGPRLDSLGNTLEPS